MNRSRSTASSAALTEAAVRMAARSMLWGLRKLHALPAMAGRAVMLVRGARSMQRVRGTLWRRGRPAHWQASPLQDYEPAVTRSVPLGSAGFVLLWGYRRRSVVLRTLKLAHPRLIEAFGYRTRALEPLHWPARVGFEAMVELTLAEVRSMVASVESHDRATQGERPAAITAAGAGGVGPVEALLAAVPSKEPATAIDAGQVRVLASSAQALAPPPEDAAGSASKAAGRRRVVETHEGVLKASGTYVRTMGERRFEQFAVDLLGRDSGATLRIWGTDLHRALAASGARTGDFVRVEHNGYSRMAFPDGRGHTNLKHYTIDVLERSA